jgi:hypothetical protein
VKSAREQSNEEGENAGQPLHASSTVSPVLVYDDVSEAAEWLCETIE